MRRSNVTWTPELLDRYLADPQGGVFRGNRMPFAGIPDAQARADLIAYLVQALK
jgi:cytochrome c2